MASDSLEAVLFDYDGTLRDTVPEIHRGVNRVLSAHGLPTQTLYDFHATFTNPSHDYWRARGMMKPHEVVVHEWLSSCDIDRSELFPDTVNTLERVTSMGLPCALISGHTHEYVVRHAEESGIAGYFAHIEGDASHKVGAIISFVERVGVAPERTLYVGDFVSDMRDAREAGVVGVGITRGTGSREALIRAGACYVIVHLDELFLLSLVWPEVRVV